MLSVLLWQLFQNGQPAPSAALGTIIIAVVLPVIFAHAPHPRRALGGGVTNADRREPDEIIRDAGRADHV